MDYIALGYSGLFLVGLIGGSPIPMNSDVPLSAAIVAGWAIVPCILAVWLGNWVGSLTTYMLGRLCTRDQILRWTKVRPSRFERVCAYVQGRGIWFALGAWLPVVGKALIISYSVLRAPFWRVAAVMALGQLIRYLITTLLTIGALQAVA